MSRIFRRAARAMVAVALAVALSLVPAVSSATDEVAERVARAVDFNRLGHYREAIDELQAAFAVRPLPRLLLQIARLYKKLGDSAAALDYYHRFLGLAPDPTARERDEIQKYEDETRPPPPPPPLPETTRPPDPPPPPEKDRLPEVRAAPTPLDQAGPTYKKWWLWTAVGGGLVVAGAAVVLGVTLTRDATLDRYDLGPQTVVFH